MPIQVSGAFPFPARNPKAGHGTLFMHYYYYYLSYLYIYSYASKKMSQCPAFMHSTVKTKDLGGGTFPFYGPGEMPLGAHRDLGGWALALARPPHHLLVVLHSRAKGFHHGQWCVYVNGP